MSYARPSVLAMFDPVQFYSPPSSPESDKENTDSVLPPSKTIVDALQPRGTRRLVDIGDETVEEQESPELPMQRVPFADLAIPPPREVISTPHRDVKHFTHPPFAPSSLSKYSPIKARYSDSENSSFRPQSPARVASPQFDSSPARSSPSEQSAVENFSPMANFTSTTPLSSKKRYNVADNSPVHPGQTSLHLNFSPRDSSFDILNDKISFLEQGHSFMSEPSLALDCQNSAQLSSHFQHAKSLNTTSSTLSRSTTKTDGNVPPLRVIKHLKSPILAPAITIINSKNSLRSTKSTIPGLKLKKGRPFSRVQSGSHLSMPSKEQVPPYQGNISSLHTGKKVDHVTDLSTRAIGAKRAFEESNAHDGHAPLRIPVKKIATTTSGGSKVGGPTSKTSLDGAGSRIALDSNPFPRPSAPPSRIACMRNGRSLPRGLHRSNIP